MPRLVNDDYNVLNEDSFQKINLNNNNEVLKGVGDGRERPPTRKLEEKCRQSA